MSEVSQAIKGEEVTRRHFLVLTGGAVAASTLAGLPVVAKANADLTKKAIDEILNGREAKSGRVSLTLPQIAENGNTVPLSVKVESPMTDKDYVKSVHLYAEGNPLPRVASINFTPANGVAEASTRIRLAKTQNVIAVAEMSDGSVYMDKVEVKVTIGGCGG